jgi:acyl-coenzyme A thioesterase PaaI-like protein
MINERNIALARLREEMERPPFHRVLRPQAIDADPDTGTVTIALGYRDELARAPNEQSFHGGVIAALIDLAGHAAVAVKMGRMAPTIDLRLTICAELTAAK